MSEVKQPSEKPTLTATKKLNHTRTHTSLGSALVGGGGPRREGFPPGPGGGGRGLDVMEPVDLVGGGGGCLGEGRGEEGRGGEGRGGEGKGKMEYCYYATDVCAYMYVHTHTHAHMHSPY